MAFHLDHSFLRNSHPRHAGPYLRKTASENQAITQALSNELIQAVARESLPPRVYTLWLCACPDETAVTLGLRQRESVLARSRAIVGFCRRFRTAKCGALWRAMGGSEGIAALLATFSVNHVVAFCKQVGKCNTAVKAREGRQELTTELVQILASRVLPESELQNPDTRPLLASYRELVYGCTPSFRDAWADNKDLPELNWDRVMETNTEWYQRQCLQKAFVGDDDLWSYAALFTRIPPRASEGDRSVPASMMFAAKVLEKLTQQSVHPTKNHDQLRAALKTIMRRIARRKISQQFATTIVQSISRYAKQYAASHGQALDLSYDERLSDFAQLWKRDPDFYEPLLSNLFRKCEAGNIATTVNTLQIVRPESRYRLLRFLLLCQHDLDIESTFQLERSRFEITPGLFTTLHKPDGRILFERFCASRGRHYSWISGSSMSVPNSNNGDPKQELLQVQLLDHDDVRLSEAISKTSQYKTEAQNARDPDVRVMWVNCAAILAVASRSLDVFKETLIWVRRFNRDPAISKFYGFGSMLRKFDTVSLLSGLPENPRVGMDLGDIATNVRKGNAAVLLLLETAATCQKEPSFYVNHWREVLHLFVDVVQRRLERVNKLQSRLHLTDETMFELVWENTLEVLISAEKLGLNADNEKLQYNEVGGPLAVWSEDDLEVKNPRLATLRFLDTLAKRRDDLWCDYRRGLSPAVATLQAPWPRGLPTQSLLPVNLESRIPQGALPYIQSRALKVIFSEPADVLRKIPEDAESRSAIGCFVDDYSKALRVHLVEGDEDERQRRTEAAWAYATTSLSEARFSPLEARRYFEAIFEEAEAPLSSFESLRYPERPTPKLPSWDDMELDEWHPDAGPHPDNIQERDLEPTCLDCMTSPIFNRDIKAEFVVPEPRITAVPMPDFWDLNRFGSVIPPDVKDAYTAAALLAMDGLSKASSKMLAAPFPATDTRYPALFLDADFLDRRYAIDWLPDRLLGDTPPALLEQLTSSLMHKLCEAQDPSSSLVTWAFRTLESLAWSDKPGLAIQYIVNTLVNLPDQSSWHRIMLHPGILKRLSEQQCRDLVSQLADTISERSRNAAHASATSQDATATKEDAPIRGRYVKVTTVKLLAQLMSDAEFVAEAYSVDVLIKLFQESSHIDIRVAIVESLTNIYNTTRGDDTAETIIKALESYVVPVAAEISERNPMSEQRWTECEELGQAPELGSSLEAPIRQALVCHIQQQRADSTATRSLVKRLYLPLIEQTKQNRHRWMKIFLHQQKAAHVLEQLPEALDCLGLLRGMLEQLPEHMPAAAFKELSDLLIIAAYPPKDVRDFIKRMEGLNPRPKNCNTFLSYMLNEAWRRSRFNGADLLKTAKFATAEYAASNELLTPEHLQAHGRAMIDRVLANDKCLHLAWKWISSEYEPRVRQKEAWQVRWQRYCRPVVEYMLERAESLRASERQKGSERRPIRLPDPFPLRLWLFSYPSMPWREDAEQATLRDKFVLELRDLVDELAHSRRPYHKRFNMVVAAAQKCYEKDFTYLAWKLGWLEDEQTGRDLTIAELLRVELADTLLRGAKKPVGALELVGVKEMLALWRGSVDEDVRDRGIETTANLAEWAKDMPDALPLFRDDVMLE